MLVLTQTQLDSWLAMYFWPFARIAGCLMVAPIFGARFVPARLRIVLAGAITLLVAPLLPTPPAVAIFSVQGLMITAQQVMIGVIVGFTLQFIFDAVGMGGQLLANSMGLSFAFNIDPMRGASTPALGQLYLLLMTMTFLALNGHLALLESLVRGFQTLPVGLNGVGPLGLWKIVHFGGQLFSGALAIALPGMTALLVVNISFGVVSRAAPTLNLFAVGFPVALIAGLLILAAGMPGVQQGFIGLVRLGLDAVNDIQGGG
jgi:flagellar biosynthesis protein FliR